MPSSTATLATFFVHQQPSHNSFARAPFMSPVAEMVSRLDCNIPSFSCHFLRLDHPRQVVEIYVLLRTHLDNVAVFVQHHVERHPPETEHPLSLFLVLAIHEEVLQPVPSGGVVPVDDLAGAVALIAAYRRKLYPLVPLVRGQVVQLVECGGAVGASGCPKVCVFERSMMRVDGRRFS